MAFDSKMSKEPPPQTCRCKCGYRCGGPGVCKLKSLDECLSQTDGNHFVKDCGHDWSGPWVNFETGGGTVTCKHCGTTAIYHDMICGP